MTPKGQGRDPDIFGAIFVGASAAAQRWCAAADAAAIRHFAN